MSRLRLAAALAAAVCLTCTSLALAAARQSGGSISGKVAVAGKPAAGIVVALVRHEGPQAPVVARTETDAEGRYRLSGVARGQYRVVAHAPAYAQDAAGNSRWGGKVVFVGEDEAVAGVDVALEPGAVITGRVVDRSGRPVVEEAIAVFRADGDEQTRGADVTSWRMVSTDDRGVYRVFGLPPGRYVVSVGDPPGRESRHRGRARNGYEQTWHPGVAGRDQARVVELGAGGEAAGVDITVGEAVPRLALSGVVVEEVSGAPVPDVVVAYVVVADGQFASYGGMIRKTDEAGRFEFVGLPAGSYRFFARSSAGGGLFSDAVDVTIAGKDALPVTLRVRRGVPLSGTLAIEGATGVISGEGPGGVELSADRLADQERDVTGFLGGLARARVAPDGTFAFEGLKPGRYVLHASDGRGPQRVVVLRLEQHGVPVESVDLTDGRPAEVRVVAANAIGTVRGRVRATGGELGGDLYVGVVAYLPGGRKQVAQARVDGRGEFVLERLPEGELEIRAIAYRPTPRGGERFEGERVSVRVAGTAPVETSVEIDLGTPKEGER